MDSRFQQALGATESSEIAGVYTVSGEGRSDFSDSELTQAAFGQLTKDGTAAVSLRYADGSLQEGSYSVDAGNEVTRRLYAKQEGSQSLVRDYVDEVTLSFSTDPCISPA